MTIFQKMQKIVTLIRRLITRITAQNIYFFNLRKIDNRNKWKNDIIVSRVKLSVELDVLVCNT